ncbi:MAG: hypothetical protein JXL80_14590 [Planctomycetes bacterium]|nr:hypothetical protein [Planctomycetota bacterium]
MGQCKRCGKKRFLLKFPLRLDIPEMRAMVSHWPWHHVQVCPDCQPAFDAEFRKRLLLLAPDAMAQDADITEPVCLLCGTQSPEAVYTPSARWVDPAAVPVLGKFSVCDDCRGKLLGGAVVSAAELQSGNDFRKLLPLLPEASAELVERNEGWRLADGPGPEGATEVLRELELEAAANTAALFWNTPPQAIAQADEPPIRGAMLLPEGKTAIRTHLALKWHTGTPDSIRRAVMDVYRSGDQFTIVRHDPPQA